MITSSAIRAVAAVVFVTLATLPAFAAEELRGLVVGVLNAQGEAVVRHDAFGGMPAMTMVFRVDEERFRRGCIPASASKPEST